MEFSSRVYEINVSIRPSLFFRRDLPRQFLLAAPSGRNNRGEGVVRRVAGNRESIKLHGHN